MIFIILNCDTFIPYQVVKNLEDNSILQTTFFDVVWIIGVEVYPIQYYNVILEYCNQLWLDQL